MERSTVEIPKSLIAGENAEDLFIYDLSDTIPPLRLRANDRLICRPPDDRPIGPDQPIVIINQRGVLCVSWLPLDAGSTLIGVALSVLRRYDTA